MRKILDPFAMLFAIACICLAFAISRPAASPIKDSCPCGSKCQCQAGQCEAQACPVP